METSTSQESGSPKTSRWTRFKEYIWRLVFIVWVTSSLAAAPLIMARIILGHEDAPWSFLYGLLSGGVAVIGLVLYLQKRATQKSRESLGRYSKEVQVAMELRKKHDQLMSTALTYIKMGMVNEACSIAEEMERITVTETKIINEILGGDSGKEKK